MFDLTRLTIRRAREERLAQVAGSLTFTTLLSIVPLLAASFALFTRFPIFKRFEQAIEDYLLKSLLPADLSRTVLKNLRRRDAIAGSLLASIAFELGKRGFAAYVLKVPTYKAMYGACAAFPVFLLWLYFSWLVTLASALVTANLARAKPRPKAADKTRARR